MKILFLEPYFGGSHKDFALGFQAHSRNEVTLVTLPDRFWKWRMRGASLYFIDQVKNFSRYDVIFTTDMLDLTDLMALAKNPFPPVFLYFHENQLSYPLSPGEKQDFHLGFTNIVSALAAERVGFNSKFHMNAFMGAAAALIKRMPDVRPGWVLDKIRAKSTVIYPGCWFEPGLPTRPDTPGTPPLIIWNHRWEHDKNPAPFFNALASLQKKKIRFSLALLGENFSECPGIFHEARDRFKQEIVVYGHLESKADYLSWLKKGDMVISCSVQENFGISVVEAVRFGCFPLLPDRLSYPEIIPESLHSQVLYQTDDVLVEKLEQLVLQRSARRSLQPELSRQMNVFSWDTLAKEYDELLEKLRH